ncbi:hypothetical protein AcW1_003157 [Taiwanofungus camphoratus]|nr:hypothetical protein AcW1_003157 [Antrodia cinnamomea]
MRPRLAPGWPFSRGRFTVGEGGREGEGGKPPNSLRQRRTCAPRPQRLAEARDSRFAIRDLWFAGRANAGGVGEKEGKREGREDSGEDGETRPGAGAKDGTLQGLVQCLPFPAVRRL